MSSEINPASSFVRPIITRDPSLTSECKEKFPTIRTRSTIPRKPIQRIGSLSASVNFTPWTHFPDSDLRYRPQRPVVEMTRGLYGLYSSGKGSQSAEKIVRWELESGAPLGQGSFGQVCRLKEVGTERPVAGKYNIPSESKFLTANKEYQSLHRWQGIPHVVRVLDGSNIRADQKLIVMERLGPNLFERMTQSGGKLPFRDVMIIVRQLLEMHQAAAAKGLVHGDLKPENIAYDEKVTVFDFGHAHSIRGKLKKENGIQSILYRAPEVILGKKYDASVDLWSIGCIAYEIFCGKQFVTAFDDNHTDHRNVFLQLGRQIALPKPAYFNGCWFQSQHFIQKGSQPIGPEIRKEAQQRGLSFQETMSFTALLTGILRFEHRISPEQALHLCRRISLEPKDLVEESKK